MSQSYSSTTANNMAAAMQQLDQDIAKNASVTTLQNDVVTYYAVQEGVRGYASLAASVAGVSDYNGSVAAQNIENFYGDTNFGPNELAVAVDLAQQD